MREQDLLELLQRRPRPQLRLHLSGGVVFEIGASDEVTLTRSTVKLLLPREGNQTREAVIGLLHIVWIEVIEPAAAT